MRSFKIKISLIPIAIVSFLVFMLCFQNAYIGSMMPRIYTVQAYGKLLALIICWAGLLLKRVNVLRSRAYICVCLIVLISMLSTVLNHGDVVACMNIFVPMVLILSVLELNKGKDEKLLTVLNTWKWLFLLMTIIDIVTEVLFPKGLYSSALYTTNWFLGYKTERFIYIFPMIVIFGYLDLRKSETLKLDFYVAYILALVSCYLSGATTCWVAMIFLMGAYLLLRMLLGSKASLKRQRMLYRLADYRVGIILYIVILVGVFMAENISFMVDLTAMLGKDITFSRRNLIWSVIIFEVMRHPVLGVGYLSSSQYTSLVAYVGGTNAHNMVLTILMYGGFVALAVYIVLFISCVRRSNKEYSIRDLFLISSVYSFLITGVTSSIMVYSTFGFLLYWLLEYEKRGDRIYEQRIVS